MNEDTLTVAYLKLFGSEPVGLEPWQIAKEILNNWNVPKLSEELAEECILKIVNHVQCPNKEITTEIVGKAEELGVELFPEIGIHDPSMDVYEWIENKRVAGKLKKEEWENQKII